MNRYALIFYGVLAVYAFFSPNMVQSKLLETLTSKVGFAPKIAGVGILARSVGETSEQTPEAITSAEGIDKQTDQEITRKFEVAVFVPATENPESQTFQQPIVIKNTGTKDDIYALQVKSSSGSVNTASLPETIQIAAGQQKTIKVKVTMPAEDESEGELRVTATSQNNPNVVGAATAFISDDGLTGSSGSDNL